MKASESTDQSDARDFSQASRATNILELTQRKLSFMLGHEQFVVVGDKRETEAAAKLWRFISKAFQGYHNIRDPEVIRKRAEAEIPLEKVYAEWSIGTDPTVHIQTIEELFASGATIVNIHSGQADQARVIEFYGNDVLQRVRKTALH